MEKPRYTRREFLKFVGLGMTSIAMQSCGLDWKESSSDQELIFAQICDPQLGMFDLQHEMKVFSQAVAQINSLNPDFAVICGDLVHTPDENLFEEFKKIQNMFNVPCYCVPGNHDVGDNPTHESLEYYRNLIGEDYYSFEHKGYVFVFVNTQLWKSPMKEETKSQDLWLKETLDAAASKNSQIFIIGHYPLFLKDVDEAEEYDNLPLAIRKELLSVFKKKGVVAVLGGHTQRLIINDYKKIQLVNGDATSKNKNNRPSGFRLWHVMSPKPFDHEFVSIEGF